MQPGEAAHRCRLRSDQQGRVTNAGCSRCRARATRSVRPQLHVYLFKSAKDRETGGRGHRHRDGVASRYGVAPWPTAADAHHVEQPRGGARERQRPADRARAESRSRPGLPRASSELTECRSRSSREQRATPDARSFASSSARGVRTVAHVRPDSARVDEWRAAFRGARCGGRHDAVGRRRDGGDAVDAAADARLLAARHDACAATRSRRRAAQAESYESIDFGLTAMLIRAAVASGSKPRFVYLSSLGVREHTSNPYLVARWRAESLLRASGLPYTIARPSFITGPGRDESRPLERVSGRRWRT